MDDIVDRLREHFGIAHRNETEAADEIERLKEELKASRGLLLVRDKQNNELRHEVAELHGGDSAAAS